MAFLHEWLGIRFGLKSPWGLLWFSLYHIKQVWPANPSSSHNPQYTCHKWLKILILLSINSQKREINNFAHALIGSMKWIYTFTFNHLEYNTAPLKGIPEPIIIHIYVHSWCNQNNVYQSICRLRFLCYAGIYTQAFTCRLPTCIYIPCSMAQYHG